MRGHSEALSDLFNVCDKVHGAGSAASAKSQLDWSCAYKAKAGILQKETMRAKAAKRPIEAWYEMYVKPLHPELAMVGMRVLSRYMHSQRALRVLSQILSASSCERNRSARGHIHSKIRNRLEPATTEKLVYVYSNSKMVAATRELDANELKVLAWDNEDAQRQRDRK